jgi:hypothetical protein
MSELIPMVVCILVISVLEIQSRRPARAANKKQKEKRRTSDLGPSNLANRLGSDCYELVPGSTEVGGFSEFANEFASCVAYSPVTRPVNTSIV